MIAAVTMVRDEADVIEHTIRHLLAHGVDRILIADNLSTDDTPAILASLAGEYPREVMLTTDTEPGYYQDRKMTNLTRRAGAWGADWVLPFDADEVWYPSGGGTLAEFFETCESDIVTGYGWDHIATHDDKPGDPFRSIVHRRDNPQSLPKVAFRAHPDASLHMGNHDVNRPGTRGPGLAYRHFQYRSLGQYVRKVRNGKEAYEASNMHWNYGTHWRIDGALSDDEIGGKWEAMCCEFDLVADPAPVLP